LSINVSLDGKVAMVAGGGRGIGAAVSEYLAQAGAAVAVIDREANRANSTAARIVGNGGRARAVVADLLYGDGTTEVVTQTVEHFGHVDILANVAGGSWAYVPSARLHEATDEEMDLVLSLNLRYVLRLCRQAIRVMLAQGGGGSIVNIASIAGAFSSPFSASYGAAKAGVISLTRTLAYEYGGDRIRVNCVAPGRIETPATPAATLGSSDGREYAQTIPLGGVGNPIDIAKAVLFFASDLASYVTGQMILVDGGASATPAVIPAASAQLRANASVRGQP
jgi:3-oxoacyl-[acyl-carrier protein] reductase